MTKYENFGDECNANTTQTRERLAWGRTQKRCCATCNMTRDHHSGIQGGGRLLRRYARILGPQTIGPETQEQRALSSVGLHGLHAGVLTLSRMDRQSDGHTKDAHNSGSGPVRAACVSVRDFWYLSVKTRRTKRTKRGMDELALGLQDKSREKWRSRGRERGEGVEDE